MGVSLIPIVILQIFYSLARRFMRIYHQSWRPEIFFLEIGWYQVQYQHYKAQRICL